MARPRKGAVLHQLAGVKSNTMRRDIAYVVEASIYVDAVTLRDTLRVIWSDDIGWHVERSVNRSVPMPYRNHSISEIQTGDLLVVSSEGITSRLRGLEATQKAVRFSFSEQ